MRQNPVKQHILVGLLAISGSVRGDDQKAEIRTDLVLERFAVSSKGDALVVPVRVAEKTYDFIVDTGATTTIFDTAIPLGQPVGVPVAHAAEGKVEVKVYDPPEAKVGRTSLRSLDVVGGMDLDRIRQVTGLPIRGILGMDFLGSHILHIDIDKGQLLLLKSVPIDAGVELPISWEPGEFAFVRGEIAPGEPIRFAVDTGAISWDSGTLGIHETASLLREGRFREIGKVLTESLGGTRTRSLIQGGTLSIGGFTVRSPIFNESYGRTPNVLGLGFWTRFAATFDFPGRKVYLRKSARFDRPDRWNATGLHLVRRRDSIVVEAVDADSPASSAGLKPGDLVEELDGRNAQEAGLFELRSTLCHGGPLTCVVRREGRDQRLSLGQAEHGH